MPSRASFRMSDRVMWRKLRSAFALAGVCGVLLTGCTVGPKYVRPAAVAPPAYKELTPENFKDTDGWKVAQPGDATCAASGGRCSTIPS